MCKKTNFYNCAFWPQRLTVTAGHAARYLNEDSSVTEDHDDQRQEEEAHEGEHVVESLLPTLDKTAVGGALSEVLWDGDGDIVKYKHLHGKTTRALLGNNYKSETTEWASV